MSVPKHLPNSGTVILLPSPQRAQPTVAPGEDYLYERVMVPARLYLQFHPTFHHQLEAALSLNE